MCAQSHSNRGLHLPVNRGIVQDNDVPRTQHAHEDLPGIREERGVVDRAIEYAGAASLSSLSATTTMRLPVRARRVIAHANVPGDSDCSGGAGPL